MSWELFDWGRKKRQLAEKNKKIEQAEMREGLERITLERFVKLEEPVGV